MNIVKTEQIGNVLLKQLQVKRKDDLIYSDGVVENEFYQGFKSNSNYGSLPAGKKYASWAHEYHLSPVRNNLLKWFPFNPNGNILEIGAGCGALTGLLCNKLEKVTALEYSYRRASITAQRHSKQTNLEVIVGGLQDFECDDQFDYITVIGVLEYADGFYGGENPHECFLSKLRKMLKPEGTLILAIENKIGLKYITGAPEDHTGRIFDSIYNYPATDKIQTFCRKELSNMLHSAGFCDLNWYYPFPDYKLPRIILSDEILPISDLDTVWSLFPSRTGHQPRKEIISEELLGKAFSKAGLFGEVANSFLVIGRTNVLFEKWRCLRFESTNSHRRTEFRTEFMICQDDKKKIVVKHPSTEKAKPFIRLIAEREKRNNEYLKENFEVVCGTLKDDHIEYEYLSYPSLQDNISGLLRQGNYQQANELFQSYIDKIYSLEKVKIIPEEFLRVIAREAHGVKSELDCLSRGLLDLTPRNILIDGDRWVVLDNEWSLDFPMPIAFLFFRVVKEMSIMLESEIRKNTREQNPAVTLLTRNFHTYYVPQAWINPIVDAGISFRQMLRWELGFQKYVSGSPKNVLGEIYARIALGKIKPFRRRKTQFSEWRKYKRERSISKMIQTIKKIFGSR